MLGIARLGFVTLLGFALFAGCSHGKPSAEATGTNGGSAGSPDFSHNPIAQAASDFLDAVLKGDTDRGKARLTPKAVQQIVANDKKFDPPGVDSPSFRVVGIGKPAEDHAFVQCEFKYNVKSMVHTEEMCCELKLVNNEWRVSGIAYGTTPDKPWILSDFETGKDIPIPRNTSTEPSGSQPGSSGDSTRPSPPRTAQEAPATTIPGAERR
ncbi:MAG TPA: hypothetical protein VHE81_22305 [Lacipirellulaceae bacterium]|nr:hypothetical protein [Lacipirellulaceae bacterium]